MDFIISNLGNFIVAGILIIIVVAIIRKMVKNKGGCAGCSSTSCPMNKNK